MVKIKQLWYYNYDLKWGVFVCWTYKCHKTFYFYYIYYKLILFVNQQKFTLSLDKKMNKNK